PKVFIQLGTKPLFTANKESFLNDYVKLAGGTNIAEDAKTGLYSREKVIRKNPDYIIITSMGLAGEDEKKVWGKFKALRAAKNNEIHIIDSRELCSPTPPSFADSLEDIAKILHPENK
ncbi:MAG: ABC transporter substrate-binding protein, partial [Candidatus Hydrogenedentes bacterium]|nr:ABC transporter substrate-binding protein [Candidatus Hydrogenedentota bacterium]